MTFYPKPMFYYQGRFVTQSSQSHCDSRFNHATRKEVTSQFRKVNMNILPLSRGLSLVFYQFLSFTQGNWASVVSCLEFPRAVLILSPWSWRRSCGHWFMLGLHLLVYVSGNRMVIAVPFLCGKLGTAHLSLSLRQLCVSLQVTVPRFSDFQSRRPRT